MNQLQQFQREAQKLHKRSGAGGPVPFQERKPAVPTEKSKSVEYLEWFVAQLNEFIRKFPKKGESPWMLFEFLQVSVVSMINIDTSVTWVHQGFLFKRKLGAHQGLVRRFFNNHCMKWSKKWAVVYTDGMLYYSDPTKDSPVVLDSLYFDTSLRIRFGPKHSRYPNSPLIKTSTRNWVLKAGSSESFLKVISKLARSVFSSPYIRSNRFSSFSPIRSQNRVKLYHDAVGYYRDLFHIFSNASRTIFITGW